MVSTKTQVQEWSSTDNELKMKMVKC